MLVAAAAATVFAVAPAPFPASAGEQRIVATPDPTAAFAAAPRSFVGAVEAVRPAAVTIRRLEHGRASSGPTGEAIGNNPGGNTDDGSRILGGLFDLLEVRALGAGVVVAPSGIVLTSARVVLATSEFEVVMLNGRRPRAALLGFDRETDIALLGLDDQTWDFPYARLADVDRARVGDRVIAIGSPYGLEGSVTAGIVSAIGSDPGAGGPGPFLQTDAAVGVGSAGGPLVNTDGEVIGIFTGAGIESGHARALGASVVRRVAAEILEKGKVVRGWLGLSVQLLTPELAKVIGAERSGLLISDVAPKSPAALAGVRPGDVLREIDGKTIDTRLDIARVLGTTAVGHVARLRIWSLGQDVTLAVTVAEEPEERAPGTAWFHTRRALGVEVRPITSDMGVVVTHVETRGPAGRGGVERGDVIREIDHRPVRAITDLPTILKDLKGGAPLLVLVQRGPDSLYVTVTPGVE